jgi:hypothetical protein
MVTKRLVWGYFFSFVSSLAACDETAKSAAPTLAASVQSTKAPAAAPSASAAPQPPGDDLGPEVTLDGKSRGLAVNAIGTGPRLYSNQMRTWVREKPSRHAQRLGYLRAGASSPTSDKAAGHDGCTKGWYPVHPRGYVCVGRGATLDGNDPVVVATREYRPDASRKLPYVYGTVRRPGPIFSKLPSAEELHRAEPDVDERMPSWLDAKGEIGASYAQDVWTPGHEPEDPRQAWESKLTRGVPPFLLDGARVPNIRRRPRGDDVVLGSMEPRVGYSFLQTFLFEGRRYGLTTDLELMPTDRLRPIQGSDFHGVRIGHDIDFPFAFVRHPNAKLYTYQASSNRLVDAGNAEYRAVLKLTGKQKFFRKRLHYETADGHYISDLHASRLDPAKRMPAWGKRGDKWIDVNLTKQTLVLYEGEKPVYATLISSGEAGLEDPEHTTATKRGIFRIHTKHVTATMASDEIGEEFELNDVPYVQYFDKEGYALHGAYWHDRFGTPKSHGCINLAPEDARRIFYWTEPRLPVGWHAVLQPLTGTVMFVHP